jgi:hypothetical protein
MMLAQGRELVRVAVAIIRIMAVIWVFFTLKLLRSRLGQSAQVKSTTVNIR